MRLKAPPLYSRQPFGRRRPGSASRANGKHPGHTAAASVVADHRWPRRSAAGTVVDVPLPPLGWVPDHAVVVTAEDVIHRTGCDHADDVAATLAARETLWPDDGADDVPDVPPRGRDAARARRPRSRPVGATDGPPPRADYRARTVFIAAVFVALILVTSVTDAVIVIGVIVVAIVAATVWLLLWIIGDSAGRRR